jgi:hypothetical protein
MKVANCNLATAGEIKYIRRTKFRGEIRAIKKQKKILYTSLSKTTRSKHY